MPPTDASGLMEARLAHAGFDHVAGVDEVGRGSLAGPLFAAAVVLPPGVELPGLRDSKMCTRVQLRRLAEQIEDIALAISVVRVRHSSIDRFGLNPCNLQALRRAVRTLSIEPDFVLVDGFKLKRFRYRALSVKKGDAVSKNVAAASIIAKVARDRAMRRYHRRFPDYGFATNVGYGTRHHWNALKRLGPCEIHRRSFFGVIGFPDDQGVVVPHGARDLEDAIEIVEREDG
ncbi:MAG TPA: ribonuclease HII [Actinomycetota bacterium]|nr:ribonuclease HII [Actinomycetota bacterium]